MMITRTYFASREKPMVCFDMPLVKALALMIEVDHYPMGKETRPGMLFLSSDNFGWDYETFNGSDIDLQWLARFSVFYQFALNKLVGGVFGYSFFYDWAKMAGVEYDWLEQTYKNIFEQFSKLCLDEIKQDFKNRSLEKMVMMAIFGVEDKYSLEVGTGMKAVDLVAVLQLMNTSEKFLEVQRDLCGTP